MDDLVDTTRRYIYLFCQTVLRELELFQEFSQVFARMYWGDTATVDPVASLREQEPVHGIQLKLDIHRSTGLTGVVVVTALPTTVMLQEFLVKMVLISSQAVQKCTNTSLG